MFEQSNKLRFEVFTIRFLICHVSRIRIKTGENGRILDWRGARPVDSSQYVLIPSGFPCLVLNPSQGC